MHAFIASFSVIIVSELGDKTFFIAAIMAMRHPRLTVFAGAIAALALMTVLSAVFGMAATIIPRVYTYYISTALFALFGLKMLKEGYYMSATEAAEELEEVQSDLRKREDEVGPFCTLVFFFACVFPSPISLSLSDIPLSFKDWFLLFRSVVTNQIFFYVLLNDLFFDFFLFCIFSF